jgi:ketosteroid isomerase-like protein
MSKSLAITEHALRLTAAVLTILLAGCAATPIPPATPDAREQVRAAETAFAQSMADRDFAAFSRFVADDAVFINAGQPLRGKAKILSAWQRYFEGPAAPFSWRPALVEVAASGDLAYSEGPVSSPAGKTIASFQSTWRLRDGRWQVVFDNGSSVCECGK